MRKWTLAMVCSVAALLLVILAISYRPAGAQGGSYAEDRALIEDLQARYMFALDFHDVDKYLKTFTPDGVLDIGDGEIKGHEAIRKIIGGMPQQAAPKDAPQLRPAAGRHNISNIVIKVNGNKASGRANWFHYGNTAQRNAAALDSFGHYEDEMAKVNGQWLFTKRKIYNEQVDKWAAKPGNPSW
jgi:hypothetical protein